MSDVPNDSRGLPLRAHRFIREIRRGDGPVPGRLVAGDDEAFVAVDAALLADWGGWEHAGAAHIAGPQDLVRRADGHEVLLPRCVERMTTFLARRHAQSEMLTIGEVVTLAASLLRGVAEAVSADARGEWWLTAEGRPVFFLGEGDTVAAESCSVLEGLVSRSMDRTAARLFERLAEALKEPRRAVHDIETWEGALFELAAPKPLRMQREDAALAPLEVRALRQQAGIGQGASAAGVGMTRRALRSRTRRHEEAATRSPGTPGRLLARGATTMREVVAGVLGRRDAKRAAAGGGRSDPYADGRGEEAPPARRRWAGPAVVAAGAAVVVVVGGALWPSAPPADAASEPVPVVETPTASEATGGDAESDPTGDAHSAGGDVVSDEPEAEKLSAPDAVALSLLHAAAQCTDGADDSCAEAWTDERLAAGGTLPAVAEPAEESTAVLVEDYGDLAAVRVHGPDGGCIVVLLRGEDGWRIRDLYEVADPPSGGASG